MKEVSLESSNIEKLGEENATSSQVSIDLKSVTSDDLLSVTNSLDGFSHVSKPSSSNSSYTIINNDADSKLSKSNSELSFEMIEKNDNTNTNAHEIPSDISFETQNSELGNMTQAQESKLSISKKTKSRLVPSDKKNGERKRWENNKKNKKGKKGKKIT